MQLIYENTSSMTVFLRFAKIGSGKTFLFMRSIILVLSISVTYEKSIPLNQTNQTIPNSKDT